MKTKLNHYLSSLWQNSWLLLFSLILQTIIVVQFTYISKGGTSLDVSTIQIFIVGLKAFIRSFGWAVLFWGIIAYIGRKEGRKEGRRNLQFGDLDILSAPIPSCFYSPSFS